MVYVFLADGFEEIEALTVVDVLRRVDIEVKTVSIKDKVVSGAHGIQVIADILIGETDINHASMLVLPGGMPGTKNLDNDAKVQEFIRTMVSNDKYIAAICAAPMIIGKMGYLKGKKAICFPGFENYLIGAVIADNPVNVDDKFITSKGPGTAIDFSLTLVSLLKGQDIADELRANMTR